MAVTAGSRGIAQIHRITKATIDHLRALGALPFIVPAMGSHGGATAAGQLAVLESYGITEAYCGCPIRSSMETVVVCQTREGFPVHFDRHAFEADHDAHVAIITGAGGAFGRATALGFVRAGARVMLTDIDPSALEATRRLSVELPETAVVVLTMVENDEAVAAALCAAHRGDPTAQRWIDAFVDGERLFSALREDELAN